MSKIIPRIHYDQGDSDLLNISFYPSVNAQTWEMVAWSPTLEMFAAVGDTSVLDFDMIMTSSDGYYWTPRTAPYKTSWQYIHWNSAHHNFVAVSQNTGSTSTVTTSNDGITWTARTSSVAANWQSIESNFFIMVAVADNGSTSSIMSSINGGVSWTTRTSPNTNRWMGVAWSGTVFAAVSRSGTGNRVITSSDGVSWSSQTSAADNSWEDIAYSPDLGLFAAVSSNGSSNRVMTSDSTGVTWTSRTTPDRAYQRIVWANDRFIAVSRDSAHIVYSTNGTTWTEVAISENNLWHGITYSSKYDKVVAVGQSNINRVFNSKQNTRSNLILSDTAQLGSYNASHLSIGSNIIYSLPVSNTNQATFYVESTVDTGTLVAGSDYALIDAEFTPSALELAIFGPPIVKGGMSWEPDTGRLRVTTTGVYVFAHQSIYSGITSSTTASYVETYVLIRNSGGTQIDRIAYRTLVPSTTSVRISASELYRVTNTTISFEIQVYYVNSSGTVTIDGDSSFRTMFSCIKIA